MKQLVFLFLLVNLLHSCRNRSETGNWLVKEDSLAIPLSLWNATFNVKADAKGRPLFQSYNREQNDIILIDLDSNKKILTIKPAIDYKKAGRFVQFDVYKADSIFIVTEDNVFIVNALGDIIYQKKVSPPLKDERGEEIVLWDHNNQFPLFYNSKSKELLIRTTCNCWFMEPNYFKHKIEGWLNLETGSIRQSDYSFPANHYTAHSYAQSVFPYRVFRDSLSIVSFQSQDSLYVYNHNLQKLKSYAGKSRYQSIDFISFDTANSNDMERVKEYLIVNPIYQKLLYDPYRNVYYRFFAKEQSLKGENGTYNTIFSKELILMVFDSNFKIIDEKNIGNGYAWFFSFVTPKGLYVRKYDAQKQKENNNNYEKFTVFTWE